MLYAGIVIFGAALSQVLRLATGSRLWAGISPQEMVSVVTDAIFGMSREPAVPVVVASALIVVVVAASIAVLANRVHAVEVV